MNKQLLHPIISAIQKFPLATKWLLAPRLQIANQWKDQLNLHRFSTINLNSVTLRGIVLDLVDKQLLTAGPRISSHLRCCQVIAKVLHDALQGNHLQYFSETRSTASLVPLLNQTISELKMAGLNAKDLEADTWGGKELESPAKTQDLAWLFGHYQVELKNQNLLDYADGLKIAIDLLQTSAATLPADLVLIQPMDFEISSLERRFLTQLVQRSEHVFVLETQTQKTSFERQFKCAMGAGNEVQSVLRSCLTGLQKSKLDQVEILHPDYSTYVPLIHEKLVQLYGVADVESLPVTFSEGIACVYSRPGRALRSWIRWCRADHMQTSLVRMLREGLLNVPQGDEAVIGYSLLAHRLRELSIGFGLDRYLPALEHEINSAIEKQEKHAAAVDVDADQFSQGYDFGLNSYRTLHSLMVELIETSPTATDDALRLLQLAKQFIERFARSINKTDGYAKAKLKDDIDGMIQAVEQSPECFVDIWDWLENLPLDSRVLASGPQPGCLHVDHLSRGGHSGRTRTFFVGMDDSKVPLRHSQDPLLLDFERNNLSSELPTAAKKNHQAAADFQRLLQRLSGDVTFSYSVKSLSDDRDLFPSPLLLDSYRQLPGKELATLDDFVNQCGAAETFCPADDESLWLDERWHTDLLTENCSETRKLLIENLFPHLADGHVRRDQIASDRFTQFDGSVWDAGAVLDPTGKTAGRTSPSRLETYGTCPRKFFFRYGLGVYPPIEQEVDDQQWLDALNVGSLLHKVFENYLSDLTVKKQIPQYDRDHEVLNQILQREIGIYRQKIPVPHQDVYQRQCLQLKKTCEIFLHEEEKYCREQDAAPWILEASIGLGDTPENEIDHAAPISLVLSDGKQLTIGGRIDRIDRLGGQQSLQFAIWDYKTGSSYSFDQSDPFKQGRKLQHFLYMGMLRHRLKSQIGNDAEVKYFGYFFPSPKTAGQRLQWTAAELKQGDGVIRSICESIFNGVFLATTEESDCRFCDYLPICGSPQVTTQQARMKLEVNDWVTLQPLRALRFPETA